MIMDFMRQPSAGPRQWGNTLLLLLLIGVVAILGGLIAALGGYLIVGILAAGITGLGVVMYPRLHIILALFVALILTGLLEFFASFGQANWLSSLIAGSLLLTVALKRMGYRSPVRFSTFGILVFLYLLSLFAASLINGIPPAQALVGIRNYVPYIGVAAVLAWGDLGLATGRLLLKCLLAVALIQVPFALIQSFLVGPWRAIQRGAIGRADEAVVGTFGGSAITGGYPGEMAAFLAMMLIFVVALRRDRLVGSITATSICLLLLIPILLAETKVSLVLIPVFTLAAFWPDIRRNPRFSLAAFLIGCAAFSAIATTYYFRFWGDASIASQQLSYSFDPTFRPDPLHRGRVGTLIHWYQSNIEYGTYHYALVGHGAASTLENSLTIGMGTAVRSYGLGLDTHAMSRLLWDGGILAFGLLFAIGARSTIVALRLASRHLPPGHERAAATLCAVASLGMTLMLPYQLSIFGSSGMQFLFWFVVGYVEMLRRHAGAHGKEQRFTRPLELSRR